MLNRRQFIVSSLIAGRMLSAQAGAGAQSRGQHRLPANDAHLKRVRDYVEDIPVPEYHWASDRAYEAFRDIKYGVRLHWGIYSTLKLRGESWPFLAMSFEERQRYQQIYKTWNPRGFDAGAWMDLFAECGMRMFAFTSKHHDGFSLFDTKTRVVRRANWTAEGGPRLEDCNLAYSSIYPLGSSFSYEDDPARHKGAAWIVRNIVDCAAKGGNFMVGIGPDGDGQFHPTAKEQLREAGAWLKVNGQGIYATREREGELWREGEGGRFTRSKDGSLVHAFMLSWPGEYLKLASVRPRSGAAIHFLGHPDPLSWRLENGSLIIDLPESLQDPARRPCQFAWGLSIPIQK
ncbi:MAG: alpha-L-fucosidase [Blastocatellia bacterium]|nr:alpha-L-fucosidase [Blastocatellia bacterium]